MLFHNPEGVQKVKEHREYIESGAQAETEQYFTEQVEKMFGRKIGIDYSDTNRESLPQEALDEMIIKKSKNKKGK